MPLRDHFRPPMDVQTGWEGLHSGWPMVMVQHLGISLPARYVAAPNVHSGAQVEIDVATFDAGAPSPSDQPSIKNSGTATAVWTPTKPTLAVETALPDDDTYELRVYDRTRDRRLVAAVELVSPSNKDRPANRNVFVAKCVALLHQQVTVVIIDLITVRDFNLYAYLLSLLSLSDSDLGEPPSGLYAVCCRWRPDEDKPVLEAWYQPLQCGHALPTLPLWLTREFAVPLDLEASYEQTCRDLRIP